jgi:2-dehydro-3-deoxyphosphogluconate aldolase/(4S)-4-hydroxy-2-oxoglutarate aldolase
VSIPAGFTATEIALAVNSGADYVKLFPADQVGASYVKAVKAPLSDAKLLAVGGVDENNAGEWLKNGFCGVGVGSNLYNKKLIDAGDFDGLAQLAAKFMAALRQEGQKR